MTSDQSQDTVRRVDPSEVLALVEHADTGGHWYWLGDVTHEGIDPVPVVRKYGRMWLVMAVLLPATPSLHRVNSCGLRTCVNPDHWKLVPVGKQAVMTDFDGKGWRKLG